MSNTAEEKRRRAARLNAVGAALGRLIARSPVSVTYAAVFLLTSIVCGTLAGPASVATRDAWAVGLGPLFHAGHWWSPLSALLIPWDPFQMVACVLGALLILGIAERLMGSLRLVVSFLVTGVGAFVAVTILQWIGSIVGEWWARETATDVTLDPLTGMVGALLTASAFAPGLWRRRIRIVTLAILLVFVLYDGDPSNVYRSVAAIGGLILGHLVARMSPPQTWHRSSHRETRSLLATIVAVTAIGPVVSMINPNTTSLFGIVGSLFSQTFPNVDQTLENCAEANADFCASTFTVASSYGLGQIVLIFIPLVFLLVAAYGMRKGRRFALWLAIVINVALCGLSFFAFDLVHTITAESGQPLTLRLGEFILLVVSAALLPLVVAAVLWVNRQHFPLVAPRSAVVRLVSVVGVAFIVASTVWIATGLVALQTFAPHISVVDLLTDLPRRFIPANFVGPAETKFVPRNDLALFVFHWVGPFFWAIVVVEIVRLFRATRLHVRAGDYSRMRSLLRRHGGGSLGHMTLWTGNAYWFSTDHECAVAYRVINGIAIALADPVAPKDRIEETIRSFVSFSDHNGWRPVFYSIHERYLSLFETMGWKHLSVGEETVVHLDDVELGTKEWTKIRHAYNKGIRNNVTTQWTAWRDLPLSMMNEIKELSEEWVAEKQLPELGFTLGGLEELTDPDVRLSLAVGEDGRLQAVTSWLPHFDDGKLLGWTLDFMRRTDTGINGVMEFLIASTALRLKEEGLEVLSLSGAPLAARPNTDDGATPPGTLARLLTALARILEPAYGFASLFRFKAKFNPHYETLLLTYSDALALPTIGAALTKAYLPEASAKDYAALVNILSK